MISGECGDVTEQTDQRTKIVLLQLLRDYKHHVIYLTKIRAAKFTNFCASKNPSIKSDDDKDCTPEDSVSGMHMILCLTTQPVTVTLLLNILCKVITL